MTTVARNKLNHTFDELTFTDGPLIGLGIRAYHLVVEPQADQALCVISSKPTIEGIKAQSHIVAVEIISEPTRRAVREKVARGMAKLYYHIQVKRNPKFGRGLTGLSFRVVMFGTTPDTYVTYDMLISTDELLGTR